MKNQTKGKNFIIVIAIILVVCLAIGLIYSYGKRKQNTIFMYDISTTFIGDSAGVDLGTEYEQKTGTRIQAVSFTEDPATQEKLLEDILAGEGKYDLYALSMDQEDYQDYIDQGAYYDLSSSEKLVQCVQDMYPVVGETAWHGEELIGIPYQVNGEVLCYSKNAGKRYNAASFATMETLLDEIEKTDEQKIYKLMDARMEVIIMQQYLAGCSIDGAYNFDSQEFRQTLSLLRRVKEMGLPESISVSGVPPYFLPAEYDFGWADLYDYNNMSGEELRYPSIVGEPGYITGKVIFIVLNPNSEKKEEAIKYLEYMYQNQMIRGNTLLYQNAAYPTMADVMNHHMFFPSEGKKRVMDFLTEICKSIEAGVSDEEIISNCINGKY